MLVPEGLYRLIHGEPLVLPQMTGRPAPKTSAREEPVASTPKQEKQKPLT